MSRSVKALTYSFGTACPVSAGSLVSLMAAA